MVEHTVMDQDSGIKMDSPDALGAVEPLLANINGQNGSRASPHRSSNIKDEDRVTPGHGNDHTFDAVLESQKTFQKIAAQLGG